MKVTKPLVDKILKTLPIGYYIRRKVNVELTNEKNSYCDLMNDKIYISYPSIVSALKGSDIREDDLEKDIRCLLYHEVSHSYLTPKTLRPTHIINIFEDERIESLLRNYYKSVDFREFVIRINNYKGEEPKNAMEEFYQTVRFRKGKKRHLESVHNIIAENSDINRNYERYEYSGYITNINGLYKRIEKEWEEKNKEISCDKEKSKASPEQDISTFDRKEMSDESNSIPNSNKSLNEESKELYKSEQPLSEMMSETIKGEFLFSSFIESFIDVNLNNQIERILSQNRNLSRQNASAICSYSGVFSPRNVARDDYKYFAQQNRLGNLKAYSKMHLNLFIDRSGSFRSSEKKVNCLLYALTQFEKSNPDFDYDLITCGIGQTICDKKDRVLVTGGGNYLDDNIFSQFILVQKPNAQNINIVLFDGDALSDCYRISRDADNFNAFNTSNTIIISDESNKAYIKPRCDKAKVIFTTNYAKELEFYILKTLEKMIKIM